MDEQATTDDLGYIKLPRKLRLPAATVALALLFGAAAWLTRLEHMVGEALAKKKTDIALMQKLDKKLCLLCLIQLDTKTCLDRNICELGQVPQWADRE